MVLIIGNLAGAIALLLWSVRLVRTGIERGFSGPLRTGVRHASRNRVTAAASGFFAAIAMQSSTAVAMLVAGFVAAGTLPMFSSLAVILGADLGSAIAARILLTPISAIVPALLVVGVALFLKGRSRRIKQSGRILIGIALVLTSLTMIRTATAPLQDNEATELLFTYLASDLLTSFAIGAILAWATHSSIATVLTVVAMASEGLLQAPVAAAIVLGANLGGATIPVLLTLSAAYTARRVMLGNLLVRGGGAVLVLLALIQWPEHLSLLGASASTQAINLHLAFNVIVLLVGLPLLKPALHAAALIFPKTVATKPRRISALDKTATQPDRALACAAREVLEMGEQVHGMLIPIMGLFRDWDENVATQIRMSEDDVDRMHFEVKLYVAHLQESALSPRQASRAMDIVTISNHLEDAGDQISSNLVEIAQRLHADGLAFSEEGWSDLCDFHDQVVSNVQLGLNVLMTGDAEAAIQLVEEKDRMREAEQRLQSNHLDRLRGGNAASIETSNLHQETIRALKQVNTAFTYTAYPIAESTGALLSSRLAQGEGAES
ncbi:Na/Pi cotransporter family protein [Litoreibacter arenae]|uniref:Sodium-dependent phosphate transporter n=1 Tax=Litoreibacter arenae DSM 19593 TaxID=1123360 RepID=S9RUZ4_9RHOB|nr:Na/Pi cotransporter family protein [Litoreibacter arenae]EPX77774.1 Sodium-dependent phosphate transporter [Litoreibacter arenae DSM 19593]